MIAVPEYVELQVTSNFSFLEGAAHPEELAARAAELGHQAVAITDRNTLAGVVRGHLGAKQAEIRVIVGVRLDFMDSSPSLLCLPTDKVAYSRLSQLLTLGKRRAEKAQCHLTIADLTDPDGNFQRGLDQILIILPPDDLTENPEGILSSFLNRLSDELESETYLAASHLYRGDDTRRLARLAAIAEECATPLVATNDVRYHAVERRALADVVTCIRAHCTIDNAGRRLAVNAERHLKPATEMARLFRDYPDAIARTAEIAARCRFSLDELRYEYPAEPGAAGHTPDAELARLTWRGAATRYPAKKYPDGIPAKVRAQLEHELTLIAELRYAAYFLTVDDIVRFARSRDILCQGRGSAANSAVCFCLGITAVDPNRLDLLFERFISAERDEPPDIDVDFEHERREEVIQYIYAKYGRERAGLAATVISYRSRSALREVGKALGLTGDTVAALSGQVWGWSNDGVPDEVVRSLGLDPDDNRLSLALRLTRELIGFPRHLSQHVGGFVITRDRLDALVPIENAAMDNRTVIEWDKDDLDALGILKIDVLALGMLTCIRKAFALLADHYDRPLELATVPPEDPAVYDMLGQADSLGVFQVESRAQMAFLPRMKPRNFYDLVIEVAIIRPGPIQGDMVHPYIRRRDGLETVEFPSKELEDVLGKTLGVPLFQEQAMKIAIVAAGFTPGEADQLRRAMATFRKTGTIHTFHAKMVEGMAARGYDRDFAERCFRQIEGFGEYGFPESHAASFALLVYVSSWLKCHHPDVFAAALLNSQPMGFYAPAQIVRDAREHDVEVRGPDVNHSLWDNRLEPLPDSKDGGHALRLGYRQIKSLNREAAEAVAAALPDAGYLSVEDVWRRTNVNTAALVALAEAGAFGSLGLERREALWAIRALGHNGRETSAALPLFAVADARDVAPEVSPETQIALPDETPGEVVANDYAAIRMSLNHHPVGLLRDELASMNAVPARELRERPNNQRLTTVGLILVRQRPGTANGVIFLTLEDETGVANVIIWPDVFERLRKVVLSSRLVQITGRLQRQGIVTHLIAEDIVDLSHRLDALGDGSTNDSSTDEIKYGVSPDPRQSEAGGSRLAKPSLWRHPRNTHIAIKSRNFH
ncbi:MAG: error-prone DNA polymerase [Rhodospirillaceae bacterium]|nr:error-prone DNA polymerase [Rhodospirillaceae bacterium]